ncbi:hypothetical protein KPSA1_03914 [Pseudomonas syringae pv. actinidiae]|uniref:Uncharacterized protein n=1 Tax=Pseudomonas syringae pv. actinidiae TaxID=103796 RepID=A0A2V0QBP4_PSESF|nr:hypothetical protein KPSA1_03914 [Pseudomonas syringae pv. actinidiae]
MQIACDWPAVIDRTCTTVSLATAQRNPAIQIRRFNGNG